MEPLQYRIRIKELPEDLRPRERMAKDGVGALSNVELLAVLLRTGTDSMSALDLAALLLSKTGGLLGLVESKSQELLAVRGIGPAKVAQIKASIELGRRLASEVSGPRQAIKSPVDIFNLLKEKMRYLDREHFVAVSLNTKHHVITVETVSVGSLNASLVHPRELFKNSIKRSAAALVLAHNHPSGDPAPSAEDIEITRRLVDAGRLIGIDVIDHIIIGDNCYVSLKEQGVI